MVERVERAKFDAAVIFTVYSQNPLPTAFLLYLAGTPLRLAHCHENPYQLLTDWVPDPEPQKLVRHEVRRQLDLVEAVGCRISDERLSLRVPELARGRVLSLLAGLHIGREQQWVVIHPGATAPSRRYAPDRFARVAESVELGAEFFNQELRRGRASGDRGGEGVGVKGEPRNRGRVANDAGWQVVFTGTDEERELIQAIRHQMDAPSHSLAGLLDLGELASLISLAPLLIANNTGPVHMAAAVGTPVVDIYALTNPQHTPWMVPHRVLNHDVPCKYCYKSICPEGHHNCLALVTPDSVVRAARELMDELLVASCE